jgi:hypothetical protein
MASPLRNKIFHIQIAIMLVIFPFSVVAEPDSLSYKGQLSLYSHLNSRNSLPWWNGGRYIPQLNYSHHLKNDRLVDFEASMNIYGNAGLNPFDSLNLTGNVKPYRLWARYSTNQLEIRAGLQKISFGSASLLRPLMWFDQIDPRDPLKLTDGVWGILARYYFLNNANIWLWGLYGNNKIKGWETFTTSKNTPEFGGRLQLPVPRGETGLSFNHRVADLSNFSGLESAGQIPENRFGLDAKFDMVVGWWIEASWSNYNKKAGPFANQEIINAGIDYTFGLGNGLSVIYEQLTVSYDTDPFAFTKNTTFSLLNFSYPIGLFNNLNAIVYYDWTNNNAYNFVTWQRQFNKFTFYMIGYLNPRSYKIPSQETNGVTYAGNGLQIMLVFNH